MKIKAVSVKTGLTKKTIRFYEEEGLIQPGKPITTGAPIGTNPAPRRIPEGRISYEDQRSQ